MSFISAITGIIVGGIIGFIFGHLKFFREEKHRAYRELLPPILRAAYNPQERDEDEFNKALTKLWLYGNKDVAKKMDMAVSIIHDRSRGNITEAFQKAIIAMRKDLRMWRNDELKPTDVAHIYTKFS